MSSAELKGFFLPWTRSKWRLVVKSIDRHRCAGGSSVGHSPNMGPLGKSKKLIYYAFQVLKIDTTV